MKTRITIPSVSFLLALVAFVLLGGPLRAQTLADNDPTLWPEADRSFFQDGPGLLLTPEQRTELVSLNPEARTKWIEDFMDRDPIPETKGNELRQGIGKRMTLATDQFLSPRDVRAQILFLNGMPKDRVIVDCAAVFKPLEVWYYPGATGESG